MLTRYSTSFDASTKSSILQPAVSPDIFNQCSRSLIGKIEPRQHRDGLYACCSMVYSSRAQVAPQCRYKLDVLATRPSTPLTPCAQMSCHIVTQRPCTPRRDRNEGKIKLLCLACQDAGLDDGLCLLYCSAAGRLCCCSPANTLLSCATRSCLPSAVTLTLHFRLTPI